MEEPLPPMCGEKKGIVSLDGKIKKQDSESFLLSLVSGLFLHQNYLQKIKLAR